MTDPSTDRLGDLIRVVQHLDETVAEEKETNERRVTASRRKAALAMALGSLGIVVGIVGLAVGVQGRQTADDAAHAAATAQEALDVFLESRTTSRATACNEDNANREALNGAILATLTPDGLARAVETGRTGQIVEFLSKIRPLRLCDLDSIDAYYESNGERGVTPAPVPGFVSDFLAEHSAAGSG